MLPYLALESAPLPRERVAAMFWSESPQRHARNSSRRHYSNFANTVSAKSRCAGVRRDHMCLMRDARIWTFMLPRSIVAGRPPDMLWRSTQGGRSSACGLWGPESHFRDWAAMMRRHSQNRLLRALETAYQNAAIPPDMRRQVAETVLQFDPLNESACRSATQLAAAAGEVGVAWRAYAALDDVLWDCNWTWSHRRRPTGAAPEIKLGRMAAPIVAPPSERPRTSVSGAGGAAWRVRQPRRDCLCSCSAPTK